MDWFPTPIKITGVKLCQLICKLVLQLQTETYNDVNDQHWNLQMLELAASCLTLSERH